MKQIIKLIFLLSSVSLFGQTQSRMSDWNSQILGNLSKIEYKDSLNKYDFGKLWTKTGNKNVYGIIGENYQRLKIKIISTAKQNNKLDSYDIYGKSMVKDNICSFHGIISISSIKIYKVMHWGVDDEYKDQRLKKQGVLIAKYHFEEDSIQVHSGAFDGILYTSWYIDSSEKIKYDDIENNSDSYRNNQFIGTWTDYKTHKRKECNWADYRVPNCGDLDIGAGEFSPNEKYLKYGWQTYSEAYFFNNKLAKQEEEKQWWK